MKFSASILSISFLLASSYHADLFSSTQSTQALVTAPLLPNVAPNSDHLIKTEHVVAIGDQTIPYTAVVGSVSIKDKKQQPKANVFYISYTKTGGIDISSRPITFCFNGGPGSSSVWLHIGALGPKKVICNSGGLPEFPFRLEDNPYSLLDLSDLVFIDPVGTGFSKAADGVDRENFFGVDGDIETVAEFIRTYVTQNGRWLSPKLLIGESYGTTRAAGLAEYLRETAFMAFDGVVLISSVLDWQTIPRGDFSNDLASILAFPSYAAASWYHKKVNTNKSIDEFLKDAEIFSLMEYNLALIKGDKLDLKIKDRVVEKMAFFTGLSKDFILNSNMRPTVPTFGKELLKKEGKFIGRYDSRIQGDEIYPIESHALYDPSCERFTQACAATFNAYLHEDLGWVGSEEYKLLANLFPWNFQRKRSFLLNVSQDLYETMILNPHMKVFVASGIYDLATPYFATEYTLNHMQLNSELKLNITSKVYPGGHMMYLNMYNLISLKNDLADFYKHIGSSSKK